jgi:polyphosphate kinase
MPKTPIDPIVRPANRLNGHSPAEDMAKPAPFGAPVESLMAPLARPDVREGSKTFNRDLSWLEFNARVLSQALDDRLPLLERTRFLAIFTSNLDEFVMKRVGWLQRAIDSGLHAEDDTHPSPAQMLATVRKTFEHLEEQQAVCFERSIRPALKREGVHLAEYTELSADERERADTWYRRWVFPLLTPLAVDPGHRFPFISNLSSNIGVLLHQPGNPEPLFARIKVPWGGGLPQWIRVPLPEGQKPEGGRGTFVQLHDLIRHNLADLFPGMTIEEVMFFRVTRAAEGAAGSDSHDADNLLDYVEAQLRRRRFAKVVRLEISRGASPAMTTRVLEMFQLKPCDTDLSQGLLDFRSLNEIADLPRPDLKLQPWIPVQPRRLADSDSSIFELIRRGDVLVHHPYESFTASTERFIAEAAADPAVLAIKQTIYRTSRDSPFIAHLIKAAEAGKQVAVLVELQARFDEGRNVRIAQMLERAGVHVAYGVVGLKTHCKAALVVRREADGLRTYAHLGTGNYHPTTANVYTDLGLFTCNPDITDDAVNLFNLLTGRSLKRDYRKLLVAPATMKPGLLAMIAREADIARAHAEGRSPVGGRIVGKMNALEDSTITHALYKASQAGVKVELFVRGFCCLRPGVPGLSDNISVTSIVGRFLEHSRIFHFGAGKADPVQGEWFIGSADWMYRNLEQRVEAVTPVLDSACRAKLERIFEIMRVDARNAWLLQPDGRYIRRTPISSDPAADENLGTFEVLMREAAAG